jgi:hypothetical protein
MSKLIENIEEIDVTKIQVEEFVITLPLGEKRYLTKVQAQQLFECLRNALGHYQVERWNCGDLFSHASHCKVVKGVVKVCGGWSQDAT